MKQKWFFALVSILFLACGHAPQTHYFTLQMPDREIDNSARAGILYIQHFTAEAPLVQDRLVYKTSPFEFKFDHYRRWIVPPAELLTSKAVDYFRASGPFAIVTLAPPRNEDALILNARVRRFDEVLSGGERTVVIDLWIEIMNYRDRQMLWTGTLRNERPVQGSGIGAILSAMSEGTCVIFDELKSILSSAAL